MIAVIVCLLLLAIFLVWKLVLAADKLDQAEAHTKRIDDERREAKAEISALHDQLTSARSTAWVRCVGCKQLVVESDAIEQTMNVWECADCRTTYCDSCGSLNCSECNGCIRGCAWSVKVREHCDCEDRPSSQQPTLFPPRGTNGAG